MGYLDDFTKDHVKVGSKLASGAISMTQSWNKPTAEAGPISETLSIMDDVKSMTKAGGRDEDIPYQIKGGTQMTTKLLGGAQLKDTQGVATDILGGNTNLNVTDLVKNQGKLTATAKPGLLGDQGKIAKLADSKPVKAVGKLAKKGVKAGLDAVQATPELKPAVDAVKGIGKQIEKVAPMTKKITGTASKALGSTAAKAVGQTASVVTGAMTAVEGVQELSGTQKDAVGTAASAMKVIGGAAGAAAGAAGGLALMTGVAAANFWNPVGWVAGALAIGGSLVSMRDKFTV